MGAFQTSFILFVLLNVAGITDSTLSAKDRKKKNKESKEPSSKPVKFTPSQSGPSDSSVQTKGLVTPELTAKDVLEHYNSYYRGTDFKLFNGTVLGYVTPWNSHGYDVAKMFGAKFNLVSPVWLQVKPDYTIGGEHDIDLGWVEDVRETGSRLVPRILFDGWTGRDFVSLFQDQTKLSQLRKLLLKTVKKHKFDGITVEVWSQLGGQAKPQITELLNSLASAFRKAGLLFVLVIPPAMYQGDQAGMFDGSDFRNLLDQVDFFSLMTYDYSNPARPGPNSPLTWVRRCVEALDPKSSRRSKILLGLNMYGMDFTREGGGHVINRDFIKLLEKFPGSKFKFDPEAGEHFLEVKDERNKHTVFYPSLYSVSLRLELASELGTGVSLWELGQGLDFFYDLF